MGLRRPSVQHRGYCCVIDCLDVRRDREQTQAGKNGYLYFGQPNNNQYLFLSCSRPFLYPPTTIERILFVVPRSTMVCRPLDSLPQFRPLQKIHQGFIFRQLVIQHASESPQHTEPSVPREYTKEPAVFFSACRVLSRVCLSSSLVASSLMGRDALFRNFSK